MNQYHSTSYSIETEPWSSAHFLMKFFINAAKILSLTRSHHLTPYTRFEEVGSEPNDQTSRAWWVIRCKLFNWIHWTKGNICGLQFLPAYPKETKGHPVILQTSVWSTIVFITHETLLRNLLQGLWYILASCSIRSLKKMSSPVNGEEIW